MKKSNSISKKKISSKTLAVRLVAGFCAALMLVFALISALALY